MLNGQFTTSAHGCVSSCPTCNNGCTICHPCDPWRHQYPSHFGYAPNFGLTPICNCAEEIGRLRQAIEELTQRLNKTFKHTKPSENAKNDK